MATPEAEVKARKKARRLAKLGSWLVRALLATLRVKIEDRCGITKDPNFRQVIYLFWHNRLFLIPHFSEKQVSHRKGAALTSASKDGEILATFLEQFGIRAVRGSSSRRGAAALIEMIQLVRTGYDIAITPDGPRGPRYNLNPGVITLAQKTGLPILPMTVEFSSYWQLGRWDGFLLPKPFARATLTLGELYDVQKTASETEFEAERERLQARLMEMTETQ